jgi:hypothetical protein
MSRRYPLEALVEASGLTEAALGRAVGLSGSTLVKARRDGLVLDAAERYAHRAQLHVFEVWPEIVEHLEADRLERRRQIARESARRRYQEDPEVRARRIASAATQRVNNARAIRYQPSRQPEARRASSAVFYRSHADRLKADKRAHYEANRDAIRERQRQWWEANKDARNAARRAKRAQAAGATVEAMTNEENVA